MSAAATLLMTLMSAAPDLSTTADRSHDLRTGRYEEVQTLCAGYARAHPRAVKCVTFGQTPEGRPMLALVVSRTGTLEPAAAHQRKIPVVLTQGGIHAGEIDGKDASFRLLQRLLGTQRNALDKVVWVLVPVFNVDGHERFGPNHRPNQVGPEEMGWRTNAQNLNLNRDYMKVDTVEMAAMLGLLNAWDPILYVDLHVTDGADFGLHAGVMVEPIHQGPPEMSGVATAFRDGALKAARGAGHQVFPFYPSFKVEDDPMSGFAQGSSPPRFSTTYWALHNRISVLVETHSWKPYATRVKTTVDLLDAMLAAAAQNGPAWLEAAARADAAAGSIAGTSFPTRLEEGPAVETLAFPGCAYTRTPSAVSGGLRTTYNCAQPTVWNLPFHPTPVVTQSVALPRGGYVVPAAHAGWMAPKLTAHGIRFSRVASEKRGLVEAYRVTEKSFRPAPYEGRLTLTHKGSWKTETQTVDAGALWVPLAQPNARVVAHLLEPAAPDSLLAWGFFNAHLEQKEYMEPYALEAEAERMLAADPALAEAFSRQLANDKAFAASSEKRLEFFYRRHPAFDARQDLYPVFRMDAEPR